MYKGGGREKVEKERNVGECKMSKLQIAKNEEEKRGGRKGQRKGEEEEIKE